MKIKSEKYLLFFPLVIISLFILFFLLFKNAKASFFSEIADLFTNNASSTIQKESLNNDNLLRPSKTSFVSNESSTTDININEKGTLIVNSGPMRISTEKEKITEDTIVLYEIKKGDTLDTVAKLFNISKNTIIWANSLKSQSLRVGESLIILPITGITYTAVKDTTLAQVAKKYGSDISDIAEFNGISPSSKLTKGQSIIIPDVEGEIAATSVSNKNTKTVVSNAKQIQYKTNAVLGYFMKPVSCIKTQSLHGPYHTGIDFGCHIGTAVAAAANGVVIRSVSGGYNGGYGSVVIISHPNGTQSIYAHLSKINVSVGQKITQGQIIGATGNTGKSTGPHLHFETRGTSNPF